MNLSTYFNFRFVQVPPSLLRLDFDLNVAWIASSCDESHGHIIQIDCYRGRHISLCGPSDLHGSPLP